MQRETTECVIIRDEHGNKVGVVMRDEDKRMPVTYCIHEANWDEYMELYGKTLQKNG